MQREDGDMLGYISCVSKRIDPVQHFGYLSRRWNSRVQWYMGTSHGAVRIANWRDDVRPTDMQQYLSSSCHTVPPYLPNK